MEHSVPYLEKITGQLEKRLESLRLSQQNFHVFSEMISQVGIESKIQFPPDWPLFCSQDQELLELIKKVNILL